MKRWTLALGTPTCLRRWDPETLTFYWQSEPAAQDGHLHTWEEVMEFMNQVGDDWAIGDKLTIKRVQ